MCGVWLNLKIVLLHHLVPVKDETVFLFPFYCVRLFVRWHLGYCKITFGGETTADPFTPKIKESFFISLIRACVSNEILERGSSVRGEEYFSEFSVGVCCPVL